MHVVLQGLFVKAGQQTALGPLDENDLDGGDGDESDADDLADQLAQSANIH